MNTPNIIWTCIQIDCIDVDFMGDVEEQLKVTFQAEYIPYIGTLDGVLRTGSNVSPSSDTASAFSSIKEDDDAYSKSTAPRRHSTHSFAQSSQSSQPPRSPPSPRFSPSLLQTEAHARAQESASAAASATSAANAASHSTGGGRGDTDGSSVSSGSSSMSNESGMRGVLEKSILRREKENMIMHNLEVPNSQFGAKAAGAGTCKGSARAPHRCMHNIYINIYAYHISIQSKHEISTHGYNYIHVSKDI